MYLLLCRATYPLTEAHPNSIGLSSQWATGKRNTVCPLSRAASSVKYSGSGLFCLTFSSNVRLISWPSKCIPRCHNQSFISSILFAVVGGLSFSLLWYVALSSTITEFGGMFGSNCCCQPFYIVLIVHFIVVVSRVCL